jgi:uncharacterized membrane protein
VDVLTGITLAAPAGLNAYIPLLAVALSQHKGWIHLTGPYAHMGDFWFIALVSVLLIVEIVADKVPAVDHVNDLIQTLVRPAAGGLLAVSAAGEGKLEPWLLLAAGVIIAGGVHAVKASARPLINGLSGGAAGPAASTVEDFGAFGLSVIAIAAPVIAAIVSVLTLGGAIWGVTRWRRRRAAKDAEQAAASAPAAAAATAGPETPGS